MQKVKAFFHLFSGSLLPQTKLYQKFLREKMSYSLKYFILINFILSTLFILFLVIKINPFRLNSLIVSLNSSLTKYPDDLSIKINKGFLVANYNRPYLLWMDYNKKKYLLVMVDESASMSKKSEYRPSILLTKTNAILKNVNDYKLSTIIPLTVVPEQIIDKSTVNVVQLYLEKIRKYLPAFFFASSLIAFFLLPLFSSVVYLAYLISSSLLIYLLFKFFSNKTPGLTYLKTLQLSLHAITLPLVLDYGLTTFNLKTKPSPLLFFILVLVFVFASVYEAYFGHRHKALHLHKAVARQ